MGGGFSSGGTLGGGFSSGGTLGGNFFSSGGTLDGGFSSGGTLGGSFFSSGGTLGGGFSSCGFSSGGFSSGGEEDVKRGTNDQIMVVAVGGPPPASHCRNLSPSWSYNTTSRCHFVYKVAPS